MRVRIHESSLSSRSLTAAPCQEHLQRPAGALGVAAVVGLAEEVGEAPLWLRRQRTWNQVTNLRPTPHLRQLAAAVAPPARLVVRPIRPAPEVSTTTTRSIARSTATCRNGRSAGKM